jgi:hypothetical protein
MLIINNQSIFCIINNHDPVLIIYNSPNQRPRTYNQVIDYLQYRYVVIINNHDLISIVYNGVFIIYNTSIIINNLVLQLVLFIKAV